MSVPSLHTPTSHSDLLDVSNKNRKRPIGTKRELEVSKQTLALYNGADALEKLSEASAKRPKPAEGDAFHRTEEIYDSTFLDV